MCSPNTGTHAIVCWRGSRQRSVGLFALIGTQQGPPRWLMLEGDHTETSVGVEAVASGSAPDSVRTRPTCPSTSTASAGRPASSLRRAGGGPPAAPPPPARPPAGGGGERNPRPPAGGPPPPPGGERRRPGGTRGPP